MDQVLQGFEKRAKEKPKSKARYERMRKTAFMRTYAAGRGPIDQTTGKRRTFRMFAPGTTPEQANKLDVSQGAIAD